MPQILCVECLKLCKHLSKAPVMIPGGRTWLGTKYYCCVCAGTRVFNRARIVEMQPVKKFGFIQGEKENFFFHFSDCRDDFDFIPHKGMLVDFEVVFLKDKTHSYKAVNIKQVGNRR